MLTVNNLEPRGFRLIGRIPAPKAIDSKAGVARMFQNSGLRVASELYRHADEFAYPSTSHLSPEYLLLSRPVRTRSRDLILLYRANKFEWPSLRQSIALFRENAPQLKPYCREPILNQGVHRFADGRLRALTFAPNEVLERQVSVFPVDSSGCWPAHFLFLAVPKFAETRRTTV